LNLSEQQRWLLATLEREGDKYLRPTAQLEPIGKPLAQLGLIELNLVVSLYGFIPYLSITAAGRAAIRGPELGPTPPPFARSDR